MIAVECTVKHYLVRPRDIYLLRFILEGYDGLAVVTTLNRESGLVQISIAPGCEDELEQILTAENSGLDVKPVNIRPASVDPV